MKCDVFVCKSDCNLPFTCTLYVDLCLCRCVSGSMWVKMSHVFVFTCLIASIRVQFILILLLYLFPAVPMFGCV